MHSNPVSAPTPWGDDVDLAARELAERYVAARRAEAVAQAAVARVLAEAAELAASRVAALPRATSKEAELPVRAVAAELAVAAREPDGAVQRQMGEAAMVVREFPQAMTAWGEGRIGARHVRVITELGTPLADPVAREAFETEAVRHAESMTPRRLRAALAPVAEELQPGSLSERHRAARARRGVWTTMLEDGMGSLTVVQPAVIVEGIQDRLTQQARAVKNLDPTDTRTLDQIRADLAADMLLTSTPNVETGEGLADGYGGLGAITAIVNVTVPALALAGVTAEPGELVGKTPIDADTARELAARAPGWDRILTDPITGCVLAVDRYTPSAEMKRHLRARDRHCRFPGCRQPTHRCDLDHTTDYAHGGKTRTGNLAHLCRRHHTLKGETPWKVTQHGGGVLQWTSPGGLTYTDQPPTPPPPPRVRFETDDEYANAHGEPPPF